MKFLDIKQTRAIAWDQPTLALLLAELEVTSTPTLTVYLGRRYKRVEFGRQEALDIVDRVGQILAANPTPVLPENREGEEP